MLKCIIIDDQKEAVELLTDHVKNTPSLVLKLATTNPIEALSYLDKEKIDIVFLDIQMPGITGMDFIETLKEKWGRQVPRIIFSTGHEEYALQGYEYGVVDFLLKPISYKRFKIAVDRVINSFVSTALQENTDFFFAEIEGKKLKINFKDILYVEGAGNYIFIVTELKKMITYRSMNSMQELLPENNFMRVHKSYFVSINKIHSIKGNEIIINVDKSQKAIPIGITYREVVLRRLKITE